MDQKRISTKWLANVSLSTAMILAAEPQTVRAGPDIVAWGSINVNGFAPNPENYERITVPDGLSNVVAIAAGSEHSLALTAEGRVVAWGYSGWGQLNVPSGLSNVVAIAAGRDHSLALTADGWVAAWGFDWWGQTDVPLAVAYPADNVVAIAAGGEHCLALAGQFAGPVLRVELSRGISGLELWAYGAPGMSCQLLRASALTGPWLPSQQVTFTNSVQLLRHSVVASASAQFFRLLRR